MKIRLKQENWEVVQLTMAWVVEIECDGGQSFIQQFYSQN